MRFLIVLLIALCVIPAAAQTEDTAALLEAWGGEPCPDSDFTCVTLTVPLDHFDAGNAATLDVTFAVLPATGERYGAFVTATGGPGSTGIAYADDYTSYFDPAITEHYDIVFFDQRGMGMSGGLTCPLAVAAYYQNDARPTTPEGEAAFTAAARTFVADCFVEMGEPAILPYIGTEQAVEDLEAFRDAFGYEELYLYGESYGTQYVQTYAAAHPERVAMLIIDGVVDLTLTGEDFYWQQAQAFSDTLSATFAACSADPACAADFGGDAAAFYDDLAAELLAQPVAVDFPLPSGGTEARPFGISELETAAVGNVYGRGGRMVFLRLLAAAYRGDLVPLLREAYQLYSVDPATLEVIADPTYSDAMYYGVDCADYHFFADSGTPDERAAAWLRAGDAADADIPYLSQIFYTDFPCVFWGAHGSAERPAPLTGDGYVTFVLLSSTDPATPYGNGLSVYEHLSDAYVIVDDGGPHVIFGRGDYCPDTTITNYMLDGTLPAARLFICDNGQAVIRPYVPLHPTDAAAFTDGVAFMQALEDEINYLPEYWEWDVITPTTVGCPYSGTFSFEATDDGESFTFADCAFFAGANVNGEGEYIYGEAFSLNVTVTGDLAAELQYLRDEAAEMYAVTGTFNGVEVESVP